MPPASSSAVRYARKVVVLVIGGSVLIIGVVMILTPGPAVVVIPAGLAILATEFVWARRWLERFKDGAGAVAQKVRGRREESRDKAD